MKEGLNVHFIAPKTNLGDEINYFREIIKSIHARGHGLAKDWLEPVYLRFINKKPDEVIDWAASCRANIEAIPSCICARRSSLSNFSVRFNRKYIRYDCNANTPRQCNPQCASHGS